MSIVKRIKIWYNLIFRRQEMQAALKSVFYEDGRLSVVYEHPMVVIIAQELAQLFDKAHGVNYVAMDVFDKATMRDFTLIVQRTNRPNQQEIVEGLRAAVTAIHEKPQDAYFIAEKVLQRFGYIPNRSE